MSPSEAAGRRRAAAVAGHQGDTATARAAIADPDAGVRATAFGALARLGVLDRHDLLAALGDGDAGVRRRGAELAARVRPGDDDLDAAVLGLLADDDATVAETAAWALGERYEPDPDTGARLQLTPPAVLDALARAATGHDDALTREAAVAALGAIGEPTSLDALLIAADDKPAVRRRAAIALVTHLDDPRAVATLQRLATDRDWQVRDAVDILLADLDLPEPPATGP